MAILIALVLALQAGWTAAKANWMAAYERSTEQQDPSRASVVEGEQPPGAAAGIIRLRIRDRI